MRFMLGCALLPALIISACACSKADPNPAAEGVCAPAPSAAIFTCAPLDLDASGCGAPPDEMGNTDVDAGTLYPPGCLVELPYQNLIYPCSGGQACRCEVAEAHPDAAPAWACGP